ncbi:MAG: hypothetical protein M3R38_35160 [Actinomycetota bacterium]|nr:hypothetical protein [Actinomycetota bacterium]
MTSPVAGRDVATLRARTETVDDWTTIGPKLMSSGPGSGRLMVLADRVARRGAEVSPRGWVRDVGPPPHDQQGR